MMMRIKRCLLIALLFTTGCSPFVENNTIEEIAPVVFWSFNEGEEGMLKISTLVPPLINEKKRLLSKQVKLLKQGEKEFNLIYYREIKSGQLRMVLINKNLAKKGILTLIDTLLNDPDISQRLYVAVVEGSFEDYIKGQISKQADLDFFLYRMFKHYEDRHQGEMSIVNLHEFKNRLYSPYTDPFLPVFKVGKDNFKYKGTAFFQEDKLVGSIDKLYDQIFQLISNDYYLKNLSIPDLAVSIGQVRSKTQIHFNKDFSAMSIQVNLQGRIKEYRGDKNMSITEDYLSLNEEIETFLEKHTIMFLNQLQKWNVDPIGVGKLTLRPFSRPISNKEWSSYWPRMKINVEYRIDFQPIKRMNR
ncbi:Ger(x)C family spore germination C-terminal domain-containing protein [Paenibacillus sp. JMULE4]|uniref:Ger(x)C family spore germination protein n=1 Tax=Paenibacillus sp. JMULE4 TaxID=2518342 RepID=UPI0020C7321E|nr:Ger(x)C family spore germination C-terminal domain-containing protein [Paenibacillus sp. JMULE4]